MNSLKPYLGRGTLDALIEEILLERCIDFLYNNLRYYINVYSDDDVSIQVIDDHSEIKDKAWDEKSEQVQDEIYYPGLKELFNNYTMQDGTPIMDVIKESRVKWTA